MTEAAITRALAALEAEMAERGVRAPQAELTLTASGARMFLSGRQVDPGSDTPSFWLGSGRDADAALAAARAHVARLPNGKARSASEMRRALAEAIAAGRDAGLEETVITPLSEAMQQLSAREARE